MIFINGNSCQIPFNNLQAQLSNMLKTILSILILSLSFSNQSFSQSKDVRAIIEVMREEERTWNAGDVEGYVNLYAPLDSTRMILGKGVAAGKGNILAFYKKYWPKEKMGTLVLAHDSIEKLSNKFYYVSGYFQVTQADGKKVGGRFSGLMRKVKGKWMLYTDHAG